MGLYSLPGFDAWLTNDPSDDGSDELLTRIEERLAADAEEVADALGYVEPPHEQIAAAFIAGTPEAWALVREKYEAAILARLNDRAIDVLQAREEDARIAAAESRADWSDAA